MTVAEETEAMQLARSRRAAGVASDFSGQRLAVARRLKGYTKTALAGLVGVTPAAVTQFEKGKNRPTKAVLEKLADELSVPADFFRHSGLSVTLPSETAHFRSLRSTPAWARDQALAFAELSLEVVGLYERYLELPPVRVPVHRVKDVTSEPSARRAAQAVRHEWGITSGPISSMVQLLEDHGVVVLKLLEDQIDERVDGFSTSDGERPVALLSMHKNDRGRSRFDGAHELGHLVMHPGTAAGSAAIESQAHVFAGEFLAPFDELESELPRRIDWDKFLAAKKKWGVSLKSLVYRTHHAGMISDSSYQRALQQLSAWGFPEPGPLGPPETPSLLGRATAVLTEGGYEIGFLASLGRVSQHQIETVVRAATQERLTL